MSRTLFLADVSNLFENVRLKWPEHNLDYEVVVKAYAGIGCNILSKVAYLSPRKSRFNSFFGVLKKAGFVFDEYDPTAIALRVAESVGHFETLIIGTSDPAILQTLIYARQKGMSTYVFGVNVHPHLERHAEVLELDDSFIRSRTQATDEVDVPTDSPSTTSVGNGE